MATELTQARLKELLHYNPDTGVFTWLASPRGGWAGKTAGYASNGYRRLRINERQYLAHCLAWLYMTGSWPSKQIDHINADRSDNRISNLRLATRSQNGANARRRVDNTSGAKGVSWHRITGKWSASLAVNGRQYHLGLFDSTAEASAAYAAAAERHFGQFARAE
jgi:hypothetical protein